MWDVDTPALWTDEARGLVLVTAKGTHELKVFDGADGALIGSWGSEGTGPGEYQRPNGVLVVEDFALVVERDNRRIQVLHMPEGTSLGSFGEDVLEYPYGLAARGSAAELELWVTDDYEYQEDVVPDDLTRRVHRFTVTLRRDGPPEVLDHSTFGAPDGDGALRVVESIQIDPEHGVLFVADESRRAYLRYGVEGSYQGERLGAGLIEGDPEGIVLVRCSDEGGYWIVTDQQDDVSFFRVFGRTDLAYVGTFRGEITTNTDGTTFAHGPVPGFPEGVMYAIHDDQALAAFDWGEIARALGLSAGCGGRG